MTAAYALTLILCLSPADRCIRIVDVWNPHGYSTRALCESRRMELTTAVVLHLRPVHVVSRCALAGRAV